MVPTEQVLKTDVTGRVWTPKTQREASLDQFESSGVSAAQFCGDGWGEISDAGELDSKTAECAARVRIGNSSIEVGGSLSGLPATRLGACDPIARRRKHDGERCEAGRVGGRD